MRRVKVDCRDERGELSPGDRSIRGMNLQDGRVSRGARVDNEAERRHTCNGRRNNIVGVRRRSTGLRANKRSGDCVKFGGERGNAVWCYGMRGRQLLL